MFLEKCFTQEKEKDAKVIKLLTCNFEIQLLIFLCQNSNYDASAGLKCRGAMTPVWHESRCTVE